VASFRLEFFCLGGLFSFSVEDLSSGPMSPGHIFLHWVLCSSRGFISSCPLSHALFLATGICSRFSLSPALRVGCQHRVLHCFDFAACLKFGSHPWHPLDLVERRSHSVPILHLDSTVASCQFLLCAGECFISPSGFRSMLDPLNPVQLCSYSGDVR
jgi:hypothetical protein